jgi:hypothetical protein
MRKFVRSAGPKALGFAVLGSMILGAAARADAPAAPHKLVLSGYADGVEGSNLLTGRYDAVVRRLAAHGVPFFADEVSASTNLCIAYIMTRAWKAAHAACDEALRDAQLEVTDPTIGSRMLHDEAVAIAYSNRAVLKAIDGQPASAADDMGKARALSRADFLSQNLVAVGELTTTVAVATRN